MAVSFKKSLPKKIVFSFTVIASLLNLLTSICNWIVIYKIVLPQKNAYYTILGKTESEWLLRGNTFVGIHDYFCVLFVIVLGLLLLLRKFSLLQYIKGLLFFYYTQACVAFSFMAIFDPALMTTGIKNLCYTRFRIQRWSITIIFAALYCLHKLLAKCISKRIDT